MKKTVLLSIAATTMIMAGGDIAPVEPVVEAPVQEASPWKLTADIKAIYQTTDLELYAGELAETGLFESGNQEVVGVSPYNAASAGGFSGRLGMTGGLFSNVRAGVEGQFYGAMGLGGDIFNDNMINAPFGGTGFDTDFDGRLSEAANLSQFWIEGTFGNTIAKVGRMELNTPLLSTEKWNLAYNTFEALTLTNTDLPQTTILGAYVDRHNGHGVGATEGGGLVAGSPGRTVNMNDFTDLHGGVFLLGAVNKSIENTTLQAWYYNMQDKPIDSVTTSQTDAFWFQADTKLMDMFTVGGQYATMNPDNVDNSSIWALKVAADVAGVNVYGAYSSADDDGYFGFANLSTADKTSIYTGLASIYFDGVLTAPGVDTFKIGASGSLADVKLAAAYINAEDIYGETIDGLDFSASTKIGPVGLTAIYTTLLTNDQDEVTPAVVGQPFYKGREIDTLRLIVSYNF